MNTIKQTACLILILLFIGSCKKQDTTTANNTNNTTDTTDTTHTNNNTNPVTHDSVFVLTSIGTQNAQGDDFTFEYDINNNLVKFYMPYTWATTSPCYVLYQNGKPFLIISAYDDFVTGIQKASMILQYGANSKMSKVYYKNPRYGLANTNPYFSDLNDGNLYYAYDSLVYTATNQLESIYRMATNNGISAPYTKIKYFYPSSSDSVAMNWSNLVLTITVTPI